jgi:hypothetical protein
MTPVDLDAFLGAIFPSKGDDEHVLLAKQTKLDGGFAHAPWPSETVDRWLRSQSAVYFNVSTVRAPAEGDYWRRRREDCIKAYCIVLDDIGSKIQGRPPVEPSWKLESSAGNFQWGYIINPTGDLDRYAAIVSALADRGFTDKGAGGYNRLMRVPGSVNIKPGRDRFVSTVTDWHPDQIRGLG